MPTRTQAPQGAPCWADLWTSDVDGSRSFYSKLLGWVAEEPSPEFGGYFMFTRAGVPVAGGMGDMGDMKADNSWKPYLSVADLEATLAAASAAGAQVVATPMPVADLGIQAIIVDPAGANTGIWQPVTFPGFTVLAEPGAPAWFELHTPDYAGSIAFYEKVFGWTTRPMPGDHGINYATFHEETAGDELAGIFDATGSLAAGAPASWSIYWHAGDTDATVASATALGGTVLEPAWDTPFGRMAELADPSGARFRVVA
jgi:uncharacterized protein